MALHVYETDEPCLSSDTWRDPLFDEVGEVPVMLQAKVLRAAVATWRSGCVEIAAKAAGIDKVTMYTERRGCTSAVPYARTSRAQSVPVNRVRILAKNGGPFPSDSGETSRSPVITMVEPGAASIIASMYCCEISMVGAPHAAELPAISRQAHLIVDRPVRSAALRHSNTFGPSASGAVGAKLFVNRSANRAVHAFVPSSIVIVELVGLPGCGGV